MTVLDHDRFPVDVKSVATEISRQWHPDDPVSLIRGASLPGFDGGLYRAPPGKSGWGILYNKDVHVVGDASTSRWPTSSATTLLHRMAYPRGHPVLSNGRRRRR